MPRKTALEEAPVGVEHVDLSNGLHVSLSADHTEHDWVLHMLGISHRTRRPLTADDVREVMALARFAGGEPSQNPLSGTWYVLFREKAGAA